VSVSSPAVVTRVRRYFFVTIHRFRPYILLLVFASVAAPASQAAQSRRPTNGEIYFRLANPCPSTGDTAGACPGYVIDHIIPTVCGGPEEPANMRWQTLAQAKEKDRWERIGCRRGHRLVLPGQEPNVTEASPIGGIADKVEAQPLPVGPSPPDSSGTDPRQDR